MITIPSTPDIVGEWIVLRHRISVISTQRRILKLGFHRPPIFCDRPDVLRPRPVESVADQALLQTLLQKFKSGMARKRHLRRHTAPCQV